MSVGREAGLDAAGAGFACLTAAKSAAGVVEPIAEMLMVGFPLLTLSACKDGGDRAGRMKFPSG